MPYYHDNYNFLVDNSNAVGYCVVWFIRASGKAKNFGSMSGIDALFWLIPALFFSMLSWIIGGFLK